MIYRDFQDVKLSALGMGAMRLPVVDGDDSKIDEAAAFAMVDEAMARGVNYYDTAWGYHSGNSELVMGKALARHPREKFYLATKFPGYDLSNMGKVEEIFEKQLEKCQVEYFDFYLFHNVCEMNIDAYLDPKYGTYDYLLDQWNIPVWVMEPLRGGKLASLAPEDEAKLKALRPDEGIPAWAFRYLQSIPSVVVTLSGMSNMEQMKENIATFETDKPLNETELETLHAIAQGMVKKIVLPCTACHYCTSHCPQGLDIPNLLSLYNEHCFTQGGFIAPMALSAIPADKQPSACIGCRSCEAVCPQGIKISEAMADFTAKLGG